MNCSELLKVIKDNSIAKTQHSSHLHFLAWHNSSTKLSMKNYCHILSIIVLSSSLLSACQESPVRPDRTNMQADTIIGYKATRIALKQLGIPYVYGGSSPHGFDCSGLVQFTYKKLGINLPRSAFYQHRYVKPIARSELQPGDLVFFSFSGNKVTHVGIYYQAQLFIHAPRSGRSVSIEYFNNDYWQERYISAGRLN